MRKAHETSQKDFILLNGEILSIEEEGRDFKVLSLEVCSNQPLWISTCVLGNHISR